MTSQLDKKALLNLLKTENERIMDLLTTFNVPDSIDDTDYDNYLLQNDKTIAEKLKTNTSRVQVDELQERLDTIKNKLKSKKSPISERAKQKREAKKLKKNKEFKKVLVSAAKAIKNENQKQGIKTDTEDTKKDMKPVTQKPIFNSEGKIVFSKFDFSAHPGAKVKKSHQNPHEVLKKIKQTDKQISELKEQGDLEKLADVKNNLAWKKAFDKVEGKKVKDDVKLLYKTIKKRKIEKKKSKQNWKDRQNKVQNDIQQRQKKREGNIQKRIKDKKNTKLKHMAKKGRVIPGF